MIALWHSWNDAGLPDERIAASLGLFAGHPASYHCEQGTAYCELSSPRPGRPRPNWRPQRTPDGGGVLFDGWIDERAELAEALGLAADTGDAQLYAAAVLRWGPAADTHIRGHYAAIVKGADGVVRLSRSPWSAPPLHYANDARRALVASVPRVLLAAGVPAQLDRTKLADNLLSNFADEERGWYLGTFRVPQGAVVTLRPGERQVSRWYDPLGVPAIRFARDADYVEAAAELLTRATRNALLDCQRPGIALSGGLDSALVADEVTRQLPEQARLPSFTFRPLAEWDGRTAADAIGDESEIVANFAATHPQVDLHFVRNEDGGFDHRWREQFVAMGLAPSYLGNFYVYHGVWQAARDTGCQWLFDATLGNQTLSNDGRWCYVEFLRRGKWRQLYLALKGRDADARPLWRQFAVLSLLPLLPKPIRRAVRGLANLGEVQPAFRFALIEPGFARESAALRRFEAMRAWSEGTYPRGREEAAALDYLGADAELADVYQGFEQIYGIRRRDVLAYRPLIEFCLGLPTGQYVRDGETRWLARRLAAGRMPDAQRFNRHYGQHNADWHARLTPRRGDILAETRRIAARPELSQLIDTRRMAALVEDWPAQTPVERFAGMPHELALTRALLTARFVNFVEGRNDI